MENRSLIWIPVIELAVLAFTTLGTTITLFLHSDSKMDEYRKETLALHERIAKQDAEFKAYLMYGTQEKQNK